MINSHQKILYVYLIQAKITKFLKIGVSGNPFARARNLQPCCGQDTTLLGMFTGGFCEERDAHKLFAESRIVGEWFKDESKIKHWFGNHPRNITMSEDDFTSMKDAQKKLLINQIRRNLVGVNISEFSRKTGLCQGTIKKACNGDLSLTISYVHLICENLGIEIPTTTS